MKEHVKYFNGDEMAADAWKNKYALGGEQTPQAMHERMALEFALEEEKKIRKEHTFWAKLTKRPNLSDYGKERQDLTFNRIMTYLNKFSHIVPQGSVMGMLGNSKIGSLSNCFVIGQPEDSYGGIFYKDQEMAQLMKRRGGVGLDISTLAPEGRPVNNAAKTSTGAASFMERYSNTTREVAQAGRRGALMLTIDVRHPDVMSFINAKKDRTKVTGANISVMLRNDFMEAVKSNRDYILRFPCEAEIPTIPDMLNMSEEAFIAEQFPLNEMVQIENTYFQRIKAKEVYDAIVENAWDNAEPGQMFIDRHWDYSPDGVYEQYKGVTTNPCGEIFMQPYDACRLIAQNFLSIVKNPFTDNSYIDYDLLYQVSYELQRLADTLVDLELKHIDRIIDKVKSDPEDDKVKQVELDLWLRIKDVASSARRTGSGFTALGDMLAALGLKYDSPEGIKTIENVMSVKAAAELDATIDLAVLHGPFKGWDNTKEFYIDVMGVHGKNDFYQMIADKFPNQADRMMRWGRRNVSWSTVNGGFIQ